MYIFHRKHTAYEFKIIWFSYGIKKQKAMIASCLVISYYQKVLAVLLHNENTTFTITA